MTESVSLEQAVDFCTNLSSTHYENFPVAKLFIPPPLRPAVSAIYAFARCADDVADEGSLSNEERQRLLTQMRQAVLGENATLPRDVQALMPAVRQTIAAYQLPKACFTDLIDAFLQDLNKKRYHSAAERLDYCKRSANPVGRLLLHLFGEFNETNAQQSDAICSVLQIINFLQDIYSDFNQRNRIYLLKQDLDALGIDEKNLFATRTQDARSTLLTIELKRCKEMLKTGKPLIRSLKSRLKWQVATIVGCAHVVIKRLEQRGANFEQRPILSKRDIPMILWSTVKQL